MLSKNTEKEKLFLFFLFCQTTQGPFFRQQPSCERAREYILYMMADNIVGVRENRSKNAGEKERKKSARV